MNTEIPGDRVLPPHPRRLRNYRADRQRNGGDSHQQSLRVPTRRRPPPHHPLRLILLHRRSGDSEGHPAGSESRQVSHHEHGHHLPAQHRHRHPGVLVDHHELRLSFISTSMLLVAFRSCSPAGPELRELQRLELATIFIPDRGAL